ncbi:MAG: hypothetical protein M3295_06490 [Chloroflexota bacterium]|nr:hypothetical protein [Chloroflexota bacterium]
MTVIPTIVVVLLSACGANSVSPSATASIERTAAPSGELDLASLGWYRWESLAELARGNAPALRFGLLDGTTHRIEVGTGPVGPFGVGTGPFPFADGPRTGTLIYGRDDGTRSGLHAISVRTGESRLVVESEEIIWTAGIGPSGADVYYLLVARATGAQLGLWHFNIDQDEEPTLVVPPVAAAARPPDVILAARVAFHATLTFSADGSRVGLRVCAAGPCTLAVLNTGSGEVREYRIGDPSPVIGLGTAFAIVDAIAPDGPEAGLLAIDLATGDRTQLADVISGAAMVEVDGADVVIFGVGDPDDQRGTSLFASELPPGGATQALGRVDEAWRIQSPSSDPSVGVELPPGWFLVFRGQPGVDPDHPVGYVAVRLVDLHAIVLDALDD